MGLKIRDVNDHEPPLITGNAEVVINASSPLENTNVINRVWKMVMDKVTDMMDYVMDESTEGDGFDGYDGKKQKSDEIKNNVEKKVNCNTKNDDSLESKVIQQFAAR